MAECTFQVSTPKLEPDSCCWNQNQTLKSWPPSCASYRELDTNLKTTLQTLFHTSFLFLYVPQVLFLEYERHANCLFLFPKELQVKSCKLMYIWHIACCLLKISYLGVNAIPIWSLVMWCIWTLIFGHFQNSLGFLKQMMY